MTTENLRSLASLHEQRKHEHEAGKPTDWELFDQIMDKVFSDDKPKDPQPKQITRSTPSFLKNLKTPSKG